MAREKSSSLFVIDLYSIGGSLLEEASEHCILLMNNKIFLQLVSIHVIFLCSAILFHISVILVFFQVKRIKSGIRILSRASCTSNFGIFV